MIQALEPSATNPASVQILGRTYEIETAQAAYALSDLGTYGVGDTVSLLLAGEAVVAAVAGPSAVQNEMCGVVARTERGTYDDGHGGTYTADTVTILATDGGHLSVPVDCRLFGCRRPRGHQLLRGGRGSAQAPELHRLSGKVSEDGTKLGSLSFASGAEILDVTGSSAVKIFSSRLAGLNLTRDMVTYYSLNGSGEINRLILEDATGDAGQYGVLTRMETLGEGMSAAYSYEYDLNGTSYTLPATTTRYPVSVGPSALLGIPLIQTACFL